MSKRNGHSTTMEKAAPIEDNIGVPRNRINPLVTAGTGGSVVSGGYLMTNEASTELIGASRYKKYSEIMVNVAIVSAAVRYFLSLVAKADWDVIPPNKTRRAKKVAKLIEDCLHDMELPWTRIVKRSAMYKFYGFSIQEWTAKRREDGMIGFKCIDPRPQSTISKWDLDVNGKVLGCVQSSPQTFEDVYLPRGKIVYLVDDSLSDSPEGLGLFRQIVAHANRLVRYEKLEGIGFETDLKGIPVGRMPYALLEQAKEDGKLTAEEKTALEQVLRDFIQNHVRALDSGLILDSAPYTGQDDTAMPTDVYQWDIELLKGGSVSFEQINTAIERKTRDMAVVLGVEHLLLGSNSSAGSYALSKDKTDSFFLNVDSTLIEIAQAGDKDIIAPLCEMNGIPKDLRPTLRPRPVQFKDLQQIGRLLKDLAYAGAPIDPRDSAVNEAREIAGLPPIDEKILPAPVNPAQPNSPQSTQNQSEDPLMDKPVVDRRSSERSTIPGETDRPE